MKEKLTIKERVQALKPGQIIWPLIIILVFLGVVVGIYNYQKDVAVNKQPTVEIAGPQDNATVTKEKTTISGTVEKNTKITVNDKSVKVDENGLFSTEVALVPGVNTFTIVATGDNGKVTIVTKKITRNAPQIATTPAVPETSNQSVSGTLSNSGPENFWIPEAGLFAAVLVGWSMTKQKLNKSLKRQA